MTSDTGFNACPACGATARCCHSESFELLKGFVTLAEVEGEETRASKLRYVLDVFALMGTEIKRVKDLGFETAVEKNHLASEVLELKEGACRYNCRNRREIWTAGFKNAITYLSYTGFMDHVVDERYKTWREKDDG